jgi:hypothetical protein
MPYGKKKGIIYTLIYIFNNITSTVKYTIYEKKSILMLYSDLKNSCDLSHYGLLCEAVTI